MKMLLSMAACLLFAQAGMAGNGMYPAKRQSDLFAATVKKPHVQAGASTGVEYFGGPVLDSVKVYSVFWGASVDSGVQQNIGGFYKAITNSSHMDLFKQYSTTVKAQDGRQGTNQSIARGSYGGEYVITPSNTKTDLDDSEVSAELEAQIVNHVLPAPDNNTLYMIYFPAGIGIGMQGSHSCTQFCAYHNFYASTKVGNLYYGVMPDFGSGMCALSCAVAGSLFDINTIVSSHEFSEAITDPQPTPGSQPAFPQAWNTSDGQEIGDLCTDGAGQVTTQAGTNYAVQAEWDNTTNACVSGPYQSDVK